MQVRAKWMWVLFLGMLIGLSGCAVANRPAVVSDDSELLARNKLELSKGAGPKQSLANLLGDADSMLGHKPPSVMDKAKAGPSGDKHDYVSYGRYCWPNPKGADLPWITIDGKSNEKQIAQGDANRYKQMLYEVHTLGLAYYYSGQQKYADQAAKLARVWFLDPATRMNPNFDFAQAVINSLPGRGIGLIENRGLVGALDGLTLIKDSSAWSPQDQQNMREWVQAFDKWLITSKNGLDERIQANNHGSWYATQKVGLYLYLGQTAEAKTTLEEIKQRITHQIEPDGKQPLEIARADGYGYSVFNLVALSTLAEYGRRNGVDLWHYEHDNRSIPHAINYMLPYAAGKERWQGKQFHRGGPGDMTGVVYAAWRGLDDRKYPEWLKTTDSEYTQSEMLLTGGP